MEEQKKKITPEKFDAMLERILDNGHPLTGWYPNMDEALDIAKEPVKNYEFIIWILESNPDLKLTEEEKEVEKFLNKVLMDATQFV